MCIRDRTVINDPTNISPAGALNVGTQTECSGIVFNPGASYTWEINDAVTNWDLLDVAGLLDVESSGTNPFTVKIVSLTPSSTPGPLKNFVNTSNYTWIIASATAGISNFNAAAFAVDLSLIHISGHNAERRGAIGRPGAVCRLLSRRHSDL